VTVVPFGSMQASSNAVSSHLGSHNTKYGSDPLLHERLSRVSRSWAPELNESSLRRNSPLSPHINLSAGGKVPKSALIPLLANASIDRRMLRYTHHALVDEGHRDNVDFIQCLCSQPHH
jgi:hypothetical protein